jgi:type VI secretion system protein ImpH
MSELASLQHEAHRFSLFAALRLIERAHAERPRLGESRRTSEDAIRLMQPPYLCFAPAELVGLYSPDGELPRLEEYSFGLFGPNGPLPLHLTEVAYERRRQLNDPTFSDFINTLQHRLIALFYRAWADCDPATNHDRPHADRFKLYVGAMLGLGFAASESRDEVLDHAKLSRAAHFGAQTRSADGLQDVLSGYFELPIVVRSFAPAWLDIPAANYSRLGERSPNAQLGIGATLGAASWQSQHQFEIVIGPLTLTTFEQFLPGAAGLRELAALVRLYTNDEWNWMLRLRLVSREVPAMQLGQGSKRGSRLGWTSWIGTRGATGDDVVLRGEACCA